MKYDCIIIGAGVAGLTSAVKLSSCGKKVLLLERQPIPGGLATSFRRQGFTFESSLHCVNALGADGEVFNFLKEYGLDEKIKLIELKDFSRIIYPEHDFSADFSCENYLNFLKSKFPQESKGLDLFFKEVLDFGRQIDEFSCSSWPRWLRIICVPFMYPKVLKASLLTIDELISKHIKDDKLKALITDIWRFMGLSPEKLSAFYFLLVFRGYYFAPTAYVGGGFGQLFRVMVDKIRENGSVVKFNTNVVNIDIDKKTGIKTVVSDKHEEFSAPVVISNANAIDTLTKLVNDECLRNRYSQSLSHLQKSISAFQVYLGLKVPAKNLGMNQHMFSVNTSYDHMRNFNYSSEGDYKNCPFSLVDHAQVDPTLVPQGKGSLLIMILDSYVNWANLPGQEYKDKKIEVANLLIRRAEKYLPGLLGQVEVMEAATPKTIERFGLSPEGSIYGFAQTVKQASENRLAQKTSIRGLILTGGWTWPGAGFHGCLVSGKEAARLALKLLK